MNNLTENFFIEGYNYFIEHGKAFVGADVASMLNQPYLDNVEVQIKSLEDAINNYKGNGNPSLHGYMAEVWHAHTFNIDAAVKRNGEIARVLLEDVHKLGSTDIGTSFGMDFGLKYCKDGSKSAYTQAVSLEDRYREYISGKGNPQTREEYLLSHGLDPNTDMSLPLYAGQVRLIPSDQMEDAIKALKVRIAHDSSIPERQEWVFRYQDTLNKLTDHIESPTGTQSMPLTLEEAKTLQTLGKEGKFDPKRFDITLADKADKWFLCQNVFMAGMNAAWISALLKVAPVIVETIKGMVKDGYIAVECVDQICVGVKNGAMDGFLKGAFCAAITTSAELGYLGKTLHSASQSANIFTPTLSAVVVLFMQALNDSVHLAKGDITKQEFAFNLEKNTYVIAGALAMGLALQAIVNIPVVSYMLGSMVGSVLGGLVFEAKEHFFMSLCVEKGYTFFGLVKQDYELPLDVRKKLGYDTFKYDSFQYKSFQSESFEYETVKYEPFDYERLDMVVLERGLIGVRRVGYI